MPVLSTTQALEALGLNVVTEPAQGALGQPQVRARATRDESVVAITLRDTTDDALDALYKSVTMPARRTRPRR